MTRFILGLALMLLPSAPIAQTTEGDVCGAVPMGANMGAMINVLALQEFPRPVRVSDPSGTVIWTNVADPPSAPDPERINFFVADAFMITCAACG